MQTQTWTRKVVSCAAPKRDSKGSPTPSGKSAHVVFVEVSSLNELLYLSRRIKY